MTNFVQVCPEIPQAGVCPVPLEWVVNHAGGIPLDEFVDMLPWMLAMILTSWGLNLLARRIHYTR